MQYGQLRPRLLASNARLYTTGFNGKKFEYFRQKNKIKYTSSIDQTTPWNTGSLNGATHDETCNQEEMNYRRSEKSIQVETVGTLQY